MSLPADYTAPEKVSNNADVVYGFETFNVTAWTDPITTGSKGGFTVAEPSQLRRVTLGVLKAPTGTDGVTVDVHLNGTTIFTNQANRPNIAASKTTASADVSVDLAPGDVVEVQVDTVGGTEPGEYLAVALGVLPARS